MGVYGGVGIEVAHRKRGESNQSIGGKSYIGHLFGEVVLRGNADVVGSCRNGEGGNDDSSLGVSDVGCGMADIGGAGVEEREHEGDGCGDGPILQSRLEAAASTVEWFLLGDALCAYV